MSPKADHKLHTSSLQLFEENFSLLIDQCENIIISYDVQKSKINNENISLINVISVNGCKTPEDFRKYLFALIEPALNKLYQSLSRVHQSYWEAHFAYISDKFDQLTLKTDDERFIFQDDEFGVTHQYHFKSFINCRLSGPNHHDPQIYGQYIRLKAVRFTEVWLEVMFGTIDRLDLMHNLLKQSVAVAGKPASDSDVNGKAEYIIKSNLTVPQLGCLFRLLVKSGLIDVPCRFNMMLINWIIHNFRSKNRESIRLMSIRNKYFTPDLHALDFWEHKIKEWQTMIQAEKDRLLQ